MQSNAQLADNREFTWFHDHHLLSIDCSHHLNYPCKIIVGGWEKKLDWVSIIDNEVEKPEFHNTIAFDLSSMAHSDDIKAWLDTIPSDINHQIDFFGAHKFFVLKLVAQWQEARDLFFSNPVLLWYWVDFCIDHKLDQETARAMLSMKQHQILAAMGYSETKSLNRLLKKIKVDSIQRYFASKLLAIMTKPDFLKTLRHIPELNQRHIDELIAMPELIHSQLLNVLADTECRWARARLMNMILDCQRMDLRLNRELAHCNTVGELERIHDRVVALRNENYINRMEVLRDEDGNPLPFPEPPHPGNDWIKPVLTSDALIDEGRSMKHCVGAYVRNVQSGTHYIYHMDEPERLTISIKMNDEKPIMIEQVAGPCNRPPSIEAKAMIDSWFVQATSEKKTK